LLVVHQEAMRVTVAAAVVREDTEHLLGHQAAGPLLSHL
jgi:hypothetical protein